MTMTATIEPDWIVERVSLCDANGGFHVTGWNLSSGEAFSWAIRESFMSPRYDYSGAELAPGVIERAIRLATLLAR